MIHADDNLIATLFRREPSTFSPVGVIAPSSKSETNRALLLAALCDGRTELHDCLVSKDTLLMAQALRDLGVSVSALDTSPTVVESDGRFRAADKPLFIGNSGTTARFLTAASCLTEGEVIIDGDEDMRQRPISPLVDSLRAIGFDISATNNAVPVRFRPTDAAHKTHIEVDGRQSTQFTSALMMLAPKLPKGLTISLTDSSVLDGSGYFDVTVKLMQAFGASVTSPEFGQWQIAATGYVSPETYHVEADYSACTYLWAAEKLRGVSVQIGNDRHSHTKQPDAQAHAFIHAFPQMPATIDGRTMQDAVPTLAVLAALNQHSVRFTGIKNLRVKECDRIAALHQGLNRVHAGLAEIDGDDLIVHGNPDLIPDNTKTSIATFNDHRIAMSFALLAYRVDGIVIENPHCVNKTFPSYWETLAKLGIVSELKSV